MRRKRRSRHDDVCRLGGNAPDESFGERYVIYDSVKGGQSECLTHYWERWSTARPRGRTIAFTALQDPLTTFS